MVCHSCNVVSEISCLQSKLRELLWKAFESSYLEAEKITTEEWDEANEERSFNVCVIQKFVENLRSISRGEVDAWVDYQVQNICDVHPFVQYMYQEIIWSIVKAKHVEKNNLQAFREKDYVVSFRKWSRQLFVLITLKLLDFPSVYDCRLKPSMVMRNVVRCKRMIDAAVAESIYTCVDWEKLRDVKQYYNMPTVLGLSQQTIGPKSDDKLVEFGSSSRAERKVSPPVNTTTPPVSHSQGQGTTSSSSAPAEPMVPYRMLQDLKKDIKREIDGRMQVSSSLDDKLSQLNSLIANFTTKVESENKQMKSEMRRELDDMKQLIKQQIRTSAAPPSSLSSTAPKEHRELKEFSQGPILNIIKKESKEPKLPAVSLSVSPFADLANLEPGSVSSTKKPNSTSNLVDFNLSDLALDKENSKAAIPYENPKALADEVNK